MPLGIVLFFWAILAAIGVAVAVAGAVLFFGSAAFRLKAKSRVGSTLGMVAGVLIGAAGSVVAIAAIAFITGWLFWGMWPHETTSRDAFEDAFSFAAGPEVTHIRGRTSSSTDSHQQFLRFHAPPQTIAKIVSTRFQRSPADDCQRESRQWQEEAPDWWTPFPAPPRAECYRASQYDQRLASNAAWLLYDPASGYAHFH